MRIRALALTLALTLSFAGGFALLGPVVSAVSGPAEATEPLPVRGLSVVTAGGPRRFEVEVAESEASRAYGLMNRDAMPPGKGMLFDFHEERNAAFWMRNTRIPLDLVFARADGTVSNVHADARPFDETALRSAGPVRYVLEINGGAAAAAGIKAGDRLDLSAR